MATANINQGDGSGNLLVGKVLVAHGSVQAQSANSAIRVLQPGSPIFMNDRIITGNEGMISILFNDAAGTQLDLGRMSDVVIDDDVFQEAGAEGPASFSEATAEVEQVQEALIAGEFDPTTDFEPTAAGPAAGGPASDGGGSSYVEFALTGEAVTPTSGAETTGVGLNFLDPQILQFEEAPVAPLADVPDEPPPPPPPPEDFAPSAGDYSSFVEERGLPEGTDGPDGSLTTTAGTFADLGIDFGGDGAGSVSFTHGAVTVPVVLDGNPATSTVLAGTYGTLTIFGNGTWQYEITDNTIVHSGINLVGAADFVPDNFTFTVFDSDGDSDGGTLTINVYDDGPVAAIEVEGIAATVEEDDMTGVPGGDQSLGNNDDGSTDFDEASSTSFGSVLPLFEVGADGPGDFGVSDDPAILSNLTTLYSKGEAVSYSSDGTTLTATAGGRDVFTLTVNNDGSWIFDLKDQLDHVDDGANNENYDLVTGDGSVGGIDFAPILTVIDADGDTAVGAGSGTFIVSIQDDVPVAVLEPRGILATVEEEDMTGVPGDDLSTGNNDDASVDQDEAGGAAGSLNQLFSVGSDEPFDYGITEDEEILGNLPSLYSNGQAVSYSSNGTTLTATADGREVFTLTVNNDGSWAFDLKDQLDHVDDGANDQNLSLVSGDGPINGIDLSTVLTITDYDGDTATGAAEGTFVVNVVDDVPIISLGEGRATGAVQEDALGNELVDGATDDTDSSLGNFENAGDTDTATLNLANLLDSPLDGADEPADVTYDITGIGVDGVKSDYTSNGAEVWYFKQDGKLVARAGNGGDDAGTVVFTFGVNSASGIATFNLDDQLDHDGLGDEETLSIGDLGSYVEATITDTDGDTDSVTFDGKIGITVENDVPIISLGEGRATGAVQEDALGNELVDGATDDTDSSLGNFENAGDTDTATMNLANLLDSPLDGADEPADVTYDITGIGVDGVKSDYTSNGAEVWYFKQDGKLV
ncbi:MAG: retention module-containing protein, partial [Desulforhopalus sp.]|nr:retention module-containing protein [Desulforhopalus sp.]